MTRDTDLTLVSPALSRQCPHSLLFERLCAFGSESLDIHFPAFISPSVALGSGKIILLHTDVPVNVSPKSNMTYCVSLVNFGISPTM